MLSRIVQPSKPAAKKPLVRSKEQSGVTSRIFNFRSSVFFWHLLLWEQMTKEVPGNRPAVISTATGTRLDEYRRFRPCQTWELVNSAPELFARTKAELLALPLFSNTSV
jgi:hypothetical protein